MGKEFTFVLFDSVYKKKCLCKTYSTNLLLSGAILIVLGILGMFWGLNFICVEYCVPAISILCMRNKISENFAGSTIIGAGLSLPVLLASYIATFVSNADIGIGTVLGGNIFNQTINYAFSVYASPNRRLQLCKVTLARETVLYLISNFLIIWTLDDDLHSSGKIADAKSGSISCVSIAWPYSLVLVICFCVYCVIEAYFDEVARMFVRCWRRGTVYTSDIPVSSPPKLLLHGGNKEEHFVVSVPSGCSHGFPSPIPSMNYFCDEERARQSKSEGSPACHASNIVGGIDSAAERVDSNMDLKASSEDAMEGGTKQIDGDQTTENRFAICLFVKDNTFAFFNIFDEIWHKRYCILHADSCMSFKSKKDSEQTGCHVTFVDLSHKSALRVKDENKMEFTVTAAYPVARTFYFRAINLQSFTLVTDAIEEMSLNSEDITDPERLRAVSESLYVQNSHKLVFETIPFHVI